MTHAIRSIVLGCATLLGAVAATTVNMPTASAHDNDHWRGERREHYRRGYYHRGGGPVLVTPAPYYGPRYHRHRYYRGGGPGYYGPGYVGPTYVAPPRPGVTFHIGR